jgi:hypothetical protein
MPGVRRIQLSDCMKEKPNKVPRLCLAVTLISLAALIILFGLHEYHYSFDPYSWANPNAETVESRNLWNQRKDLYRLLMIVFFCPAVIFGSATVVVWFRQRRAWR